MCITRQLHPRLSTIQVYLLPYLLTRNSDFISPRPSNSPSPFSSSNTTSGPTTTTTTTTTICQRALQPSCPTRTRHLPSPSPTSVCTKLWLLPRRQRCHCPNGPPRHGKRHGHRTRVRGTERLEIRQYQFTKALF